MNDQVLVCVLNGSANLPKQLQPLGDGEFVVVTLFING